MSERSFRPVVCYDFDKTIPQPEKEFYIKYRSSTSSEDGEVKEIGLIRYSHET